MNCNKYDEIFLLLANVTVLSSQWQVLSFNRLSTDTADICVESGDTPTSSSSLGSSKTIVYDNGVNANYSSEGLQKMLTGFNNSSKQRPTSAPERRNSNNIRPNSPPPLPPNSSCSSGKFFWVEKSITCKWFC